MRLTGLFLLLFPLLLLAQDDTTEKFVDAGSGLVVQIPEGWDRDSAREQGTIKFAAVLDIARGKAVRIGIETGPSDNYDQDAWLKVQKRDLEKYFKEVTTSFTVDKDFSVAGLEAVRYTIAGKVAPKEGKAYPLRVRAAAVVSGSVFFKISEYSYNGAEQGHASEIDALWDAISFQEPGLGGGEEGGGLAAPEGLTDPIPVTDKEANYKLTVPAGWELARPVPEDKNFVLRVAFRRSNAEDQGLVVVSVWRFISTRGETFSLETPTSMLDRYVKANKLIDGFYGEGASQVIRPEVREGVDFAGAEATASFEYRNNTLKEEKAIREAEALQRRGEKVTIPNPPKTVVRGRIAMVSPNIYVIFAHFARPVGDNEKLVGEFEQAMKSFELLSTEATPPPLAVGGLIGNTIEECKDVRKGKTLIRLVGRRAYRMEVSFALPPGLKRIEGKFGENVALIVVGQDEHNNWVRVDVLLENANRVSEKNMRLQPKKELFAQWRSNWESKARGTRIPHKEQSVRLGISGKGFKKLQGTVENFRGTFSGAVRDKSGWRTIVKMETRGEGDKVFEAALKKFFRSLRFKPIKH